jgi:hypothetical protein
MWWVCSTTAAAVVVVSIGLMTDRANAVVLGAPGAIHGAIDENSVVDKVQCVPGFYRQRYRGRYGCYLTDDDVYFDPSYYPYYRGGIYFGGGGFRGGFRGGAFRGGGGGGFRGGGGMRGGGGGRGSGGGRGGGGHRSDIRLKHDIVLLGHLENGLGFYRFSYNGSDKAYVGVMAQEVQSVVSDAVMRGRDGYMRVDYDRLGLPFQTWEQWVSSGRHIPATATPRN